MKSTEKMREWLTWLVKHFPALECRYRYDEFERTHWVEVSPRFIYDADQHYKAAEATLTSEFTAEYPSELVCFIPPGDVLEVEGRLEVFSGILSSAPALPALVWHEGLVPVLMNDSVQEFWFNENRWSPSLLPSSSPILVNWLAASDILVHLTGNSVFNTANWVYFDKAEPIMDVSDPKDEFAQAA